MINSIIEQYIKSANSSDLNDESKLIELNNFLKQFEYVLEKKSESFIHFICKS